MVVHGHPGDDPLRYGLDSSHGSGSSGCRSKCLFRPHHEGFSSLLVVDAVMAEARRSRMPGAIPGI